LTFSERALKENRRDEVVKLVRIALGILPSDEYKEVEAGLLRCLGRSKWDEGTSDDGLSLVMRAAVLDERYEKEVKQMEYELS
jgi:hypothetical protein